MGFSHRVADIFGDVDPPIKNKKMCYGCQKVSANVQTIHVDPYDFVSGSPILRPVEYCLSCYNERVIASMRYIRRGITT